MKSTSIMITFALFSILALLFTSSAPVSISAQAPDCNEAYLGVYSVTSFFNTTINPTDLINITTAVGVDLYYATLPQPYLFNQVWVQVGLNADEVNATFTVSVNGFTQSNINGPIQYPFSSTGTLVILTGFYSQGSSTFNNTVIITISDYNSTGATCTHADTFIIINPSASTGQVRGDPQFQGLRGQTFQVHGIDGAVYNLISDPHAQVNTRFVFLNGPRPCPRLPSTGRPSSACWSHPGSYLGELGLMTSTDELLHIVAGSAEEGFASVTLNQIPIKIEDSIPLHYLNTNVPTGLFTYNNTHELTIQLSYFTLEVENIDGFINLRAISVSPVYWPKLASHGLLGQTWQNKRYSGKIKEIEGEIDDYVLADDNLFSDSFVFNQFKH